VPGTCRFAWAAGAAAAGGLLLVAVASTAVAQQSVTLANSPATLSSALMPTGAYGIGPGGTHPAGTAVAIVDDLGFDVNAIVGAYRYYGHTTPIFGQGTIATNLEAGHFWNGHETLSHVATTTTNFVAGAESWGGESIAAKYDFHATLAAMLLGGRPTLEGGIYQVGIAPGTDLRSAAIASEWLGDSYALGFDFTIESFLAPYQATFGVADVVNSSWGFTPDSPGIDQLTVVMDAYAFQNPRTTYVVSAGNSGMAGDDTVGSPGSGYNAITVAALDGASLFNTVAAFSSRGPMDFGYLPGGDGDPVVVPGVRAAVDIAAPGTDLISAFYGGQNGGNNTTLTGSQDYGTAPDLFFFGVGGTSFAAPIVAGGATLVASAAKTLPELSDNPNASASVVVKALLLTGADKTVGWNNGQQVVNVGGTNAIVTTQSLDWAAGAGLLNLATTFDLQVNGQADVPGTGTGDLGAVVRTGWDYGASVLGKDNDYAISDWLRGGTTFTATLTWLRNRFFDFATDQYADVAQADLNLSVWEIDGNEFTTLIARSESLYNTVEHLSFTLPRSGFYGLRVEYPANTFDTTVDEVWGTEAFPQDYGLAWHAVPEPGTLLLATAGAAGWLIWRKATS
jgi:hypothetical protein